MNKIWNSIEGTGNSFVHSYDKELTGTMPSVNWKWNVPGNNKKSYLGGKIWQLKFVLYPDPTFKFLQKTIIRK